MKTRKYFVGGANTHTINEKWRTAAILKNRQIAIVWPIAMKYGMMRPLKIRFLKSKMMNRISQK